MLDTATAPPPVPPACFRVGELMTRELLAVTASNTFADAWHVMHEARIRHLPVVDGQLRLVGLVTPENVGELMMVLAARTPRRPGLPWRQNTFGPPV